MSQARLKRESSGRLREGNFPPRSLMTAVTPSPPLAKRRRRSSPVKVEYHESIGEYGLGWADWPAPQHAVREAREFILDIVMNRRSVMIVPDKDADGLSAGSLLYRTLVHLGHDPTLISVHHLKKGANVHSDIERGNMIAIEAEKIIVLDQGSRPGRALLPPVEGQTGRRVLIIDHHMSDEWPDDSQVLTACHTSPIATAALLTYILLRPLHPKVEIEESWRAVVGVIGDLGPAEAKWGTPPWPSELGRVSKRLGSKVLSDAVAGINAPRRTAEYNVSKAWTIMVNARSPADVASNAFLKLCKLDVRAETEKWARTAPRFTVDGRVAVITIDTGFQVHPVIATRWAGNLGRKSSKLIMIMCANTGFNPDPAKISFSCRIASSLRKLPENERPNLISLLNEYGNAIEGFQERVGGDFARGHKEATGGIIPKSDFALLLAQMGVPPPGTSQKRTPVKIAAPRKVIDGNQTKTIKEFFQPVKAEPV